MRYTRLGMTARIRERHARNPEKDVAMAASARDIFGWGRGGGSKRMHSKHEVNEAAMYVTETAERRMQRRVTATLERGT